MFSRAIRKLREEGIFVSVHKINNEYVHCLGKEYKQCPTNFHIKVPEMTMAGKFRSAEYYAGILYTPFKQLAVPLTVDYLKQFTLNP